MGTIFDLKNENYDDELYRANNSELEYSWFDAYKDNIANSVMHNPTVSLAKSAYSISMKMAGQNDMLTADQANELHSPITPFDKPIRNFDAVMIAEQQKADAINELLMERAGVGTIGNITSSIIGGLADPINLLGSRVASGIVARLTTPTSSLMTSKFGRVMFGGIHNLLSKATARGGATSILAKNLAEEATFIALMDLPIRSIGKAVYGEEVEPQQFFVDAVAGSILGSLADALGKGVGKVKSRINGNVLPKALKDTELDIKKAESLIENTHADAMRDVGWGEFEEGRLAIGVHNGEFVNVNTSKLNDDNSFNMETSLTPEHLDLVKQVYKDDTGLELTTEALYSDIYKMGAKISQYPQLQKVLADIGHPDVGGQNIMLYDNKGIIEAIIPEDIDISGLVDMNNYNQVFNNAYNKNVVKSMLDTAEESVDAPEKVLGKYLGADETDSGDVDAYKSEVSSLLEEASAEGKAVDDDLMKKAERYITQAQEIKSMLNDEQIETVFGINKTDIDADRIATRLEALEADGKNIEKIVKAAVLCHKRNG